MTKASARWPLCLAGGLLLTAILACSGPGMSARNPDSGGRADPASNMAADGLILNGASLDGITANEGMDSIGPILSLQVTNPTSGEVVATIPCGLVFDPLPGGDYQSFMVILEESESIPPGETAVLEAFVVCIESSNAIPDGGSTYQVGTMASGSLYNLAACLCQDEEAIAAMNGQTAGMDLLGIQFAVWMTADNVSLGDALEQMEGGEGAIGELGEILGPLLEGFASISEKWLDRCGIQITPEP